MPALPCVNHPKETTFVRCGRCDRPICVNCMVDTPVGKKCRDCARNRTHLSESTPPQVLAAFVAATAVAVPAAWLMRHIPIFYIAPFLYGACVGEVALRAGKRSRSVAMQVATGVAAVLGGIGGTGIWRVLFARAESVPSDVMAMSMAYPIIMVAVGAAIAVSRVRFL